MPPVSFLSSRFKALGIIGALLAGLVAVGLVVASRLAATPAVDARREPRPAPATQQQPGAGVVLHGIGLDPVARNEEEFDRKFGMCRRC